VHFRWCCVGFAGVLALAAADGPVGSIAFGEGMPGPPSGRADTPPVWMTGCYMSGIGSAAAAGAAHAIPWRTGTRCRRGSWCRRGTRCTRGTWCRRRCSGMSSSASWSDRHDRMRRVRSRIHIRPLACFRRHSRLLVGSRTAIWY